MIPTRNKSITAAIAITLLIFLIVGGYFLYRRQASASVSESSFPTWASTQLKDRVMHYWSEGQTWLLRETLAGRSGVLITDSCGRTNQVTPTSDEIALLGTGAKAFVSYSGKPQLAQGDSSSYTDPFRIAIKAENIVRTTDNQGTMDVKIMFTNQTNHTMYLRGLEFNYNIMGVSPGQATHYSVGGGADNPDKTLITSYIAGRSTSVITRKVNIFGVDNAAYTIAQIRVVPYYVTNGNVTYLTGSLSSNQEIISCFIEPFDVHALGGGSIAYSMAAEPSVTFTKTYYQPPTSTPTPAPTSTATKTVTPSPVASSVSSVSVGGDVDINNEFHKGWTVYGTTSTVDISRYGSNGLTIYGFDGNSNSWYSPPGTGTNAIPGFLNTESGRAYYVYSSSAKSVSLPFRPVPTSVYTLTKGWNMLYNLGDKKLNTLQFKYNGVTNSASGMIEAGVIYPNIFIIEDDQAPSACDYFSLLSSTDIAANCSAGTLAAKSSLSSGKAFWVYVR